MKIRRAQDPVEVDDGTRILVDRTWPRGTSEEKARVDLWLKDIAPSEELETYYNHEPDKWEHYKEQYFKELDAKPAVVDQVADYLKRGQVTLLHGDHGDRNTAVLVADYLKHFRHTKP
jgi:uncharacterized protein YeaO (DUF488 family)